MIAVCFKGQGVFEKNKMGAGGKPCCCIGLVARSRPIRASAPKVTSVLSELIVSRDYVSTRAGVGVGATRTGKSQLLAPNLQDLSVSPL